MTEKREIIEASKIYFDKKFGEKEFIPGQTYIPPSGKVLDADDCAHLIDASLDMWLTAGRFASQFESNLAKKFGPTDAYKYINGILDKVAMAKRAVEIKADPKRR